MTRNDGKSEQSRRALDVKEAIRQSVAKPWVKERYPAPADDPPAQLRDLVDRLDEGH